MAAARFRSWWLVPAPAAAARVSCAAGVLGAGVGGREGVFVGAGAVGVDPAGAAAHATGTSCRCAAAALRARRTVTNRATRAMRTMAHRPPEIGVETK